jgi:L-2-hydroxycarboxylate dehydrogenase (NAD+)
MAMWHDWCSAGRSPVPNLSEAGVATVQVAYNDLRDRALKILRAAGVPEEHAILVVDNLVWADARGIASHGVARLHTYVNGVRSGAVDPAARPACERDAPGASLWDGRHGLGQVVSALVVDHAVARGRQCGTHVAVAHSSHHFGAAGHWAMRAARQGCLGMAFSTAHPIVVPTGGTRPELGSNPLACALLGKQDEFVLDMATSTVALGKVEIAARSGAAMPSSWAVDASGQPVENPHAVYPAVFGGESGGLLPLGGASTTEGGHKGYGLAVMVELLCAVLSGGHDLTPGRPLDERLQGLQPVSHCFIVIDPDFLAGAERTSESLDRMLSALRASPPADPERPVLVPGDPEREAERAHTDRVTLEAKVWEDLAALEQR